MAEVKISELTSATTPLAGTETVPIVQGGVTKQVAVSGVIASKQDTLVSGTNIKTINGSSVLGSGDLTIGGGGGNPATIYINTTSGTTVGTPLTNVISLSALIPANTLTSDCQLQVVYKIKRIAGNASIYAGHIFLNTSNTLTGATQIVSSPSIGATLSYATIIRTFHFTGGNLCYLSTGTSQLTDYVTDFMSTTPFNPAVDNYLLFTIRTVNAADTARTEAALLTKYF